MWVGPVSMPSPSAVDRIAAAVPGEGVADVDAGLAGALAGGAVADRAGQVGPAVGAVGVDEDRADVAALEAAGGREGRLLVGAAGAEVVLGAEADGALAAAADQDRRAG